MSQYYYNGFNMVECGTCGHVVHIQDYLAAKDKRCEGCEEDIKELIIDEEDKEYIKGYYDSN